MSEILAKSQELVEKIYESMKIIESCEATAEDIKMATPAFVTSSDEVSVLELCGILSDEQCERVQELVLSMIAGNKAEAETFLRNLTSPTHGKGMIVNPEFEGAVAEMVARTEAQKSTETVEGAEPEDDKPEDKKEEKKSVKAVVENNYDEIGAARTAGTPWKEIAAKYQVQTQQLINAYQKETTRRAK